ncbi:MAG: tetraacyldisaccharide 4'-kinase [Candidatus Omnitrophica bacterium CG1_02_49_10]|nr:MAG: tetraacyldisaccharide 4'-kinase [Candidatus Omnitrophica bacterium CG1_02_49_10]
MDLRKYLYSIIVDELKGIIAFIIRSVLWPFSIAYGLLVKSVVKLYQWRVLKPVRVGCKVISIGNITLGGTGKTPVVEWIANIIKDKGIKAAVLLRGYGRATAERKPSVVRNGSRMRDVGDEAYVLGKNLKGIPIIVGRDRIEGAREAIKAFGAEAVILDDGFQHWRIARDLDIVTIDTTNPFGNGATIPRGTLREPISHLGRADIFILTRSNVDKGNIPYLKNILRKLNPPAVIAESIHKPSHFEVLTDENRKVEISAMTNRRVCILSAIGNPVAFDNMAEGLFLEVAMRAHFVDHHNYTKSDIEKVLERSKDAGIKDIVTTQKDAVKLEAIFASLKDKMASYGIQILVLRSHIEITSGEDILIGRLDSILSR